MSPSRLLRLWFSSVVAVGFVGRALRLPSPPLGPAKRSPSNFLPIVLLLCAVVSGCHRTRPSGDSSWKFSSAGISTVILRANSALSATVEFEPGTTEIEVSAHPALAAVGYHSRDPAGSQLPAAEWPFDLLAVREGSTLVLSSQGETIFPRHKYVLENMAIHVPGGVAVRREKQPPTRAIAP